MLISEYIVSFVTSIEILHTNILMISHFGHQFSKFLAMASYTVNFYKCTPPGCQHIGKTVSKFHSFIIHNCTHNVKISAQILVRNLT